MQPVGSLLRNARAQQSVELACALVVIVMVLAPLINLGIVPLRFELARRAVGAMVHQLSVKDKFSDALRAVQQDSGLSTTLARIGGVHLVSSQLVLSITSQKAPDRSQTADRPGRIPVAWLPDGAQSPCNYFLILTVHADIDPLVTYKVAGQSVPGINKALSFTIEEIAHWENLGRDPASGEFFVNE